jgi:hypothetical protein
MRWVLGVLWWPPECRSAGGWAHAGDTAGEVEPAHLTAGVLVVARLWRMHAAVLLSGIHAF